MSDLYADRRWIFLNKADIDSIDFDQVMQTSKDTLRHSLDGAKTFVKYPVSICPIAEAYDDEDNPIYADNVASNGDTYQFQYAQISVTGNEPNGTIDDLNNIVGSGLLAASGTVLGRPSVYEKAIEISGKTEFKHSEVLSILVGSDWTNPNPQS